MENSTYPKNRIKDLREQKGMTLRDLAEKTGWLNQTVSNLELSKAELTWSKLVKLAEIFDCNPLDLVSEDKTWRAPNKDEDTLLQAFRAMDSDDAEHLLELARKFARIGGDEFLILRGRTDLGSYNQSGNRSRTIHEKSGSGYTTASPQKTRKKPSAKK